MTDIVQILWALSRTVWGRGTWTRENFTTKKSIIGSNSNSRSIISTSLKPNTIKTTRDFKPIKYQTPVKIIKNPIPNITKDSTKTAITSKRHQLKIRKLNKARLSRNYAKKSNVIVNKATIISRENDKSY